MIIAIGSYDKRGSPCSFIDGLFPCLYELIVTLFQSHSIEASLFTSTMSSVCPSLIGLDLIGKIYASTLCRAFELTDFGAETG